MEFLSEAVSDGVSERPFVLEDVSGVIWSPDRTIDCCPLILLGHGGGQHKQAPGIVARAKRFVSFGFVAAAIDAPGHGDRPKSLYDERATAAIRQQVAAGESAVQAIGAYNADLTRKIVPEWRAVLDAYLELNPCDPSTAVGYWGISLGGVVGVALAAVEPRLSSAVIGLVGDDASREVATRVTIPIEVLLQWDDEQISRSSSLAFFDALASAEKTLHANPGRHHEVPRFEAESASRFFVRHLNPRPLTGSHSQ